MTMRWFLLVLLVGTLMWARIHRSGAARSRGAELMIRYLMLAAAVWAGFGTTALAQPRSGQARIEVPIRRSEGGSVFCFRTANGSIHSEMSQSARRSPPLSVILLDTYPFSYHGDGS